MFMILGCRKLNNPDTLNPMVVNRRKEIPQRSIIDWQQVQNPYFEIDEFICMMDDIFDTFVN